MLKIRLFGTPEVWRDEASVKINRRKSRAILYYTAAQSQPVTRAQLLEMFWIDLPRPQALQILRTTIYGLRKALGEALQVGGEKIQLQPSVDVDARRFQAGLKSMPQDLNELASLVELYQGDLLEGFTLPDSQAFEDWLLIEREHLRRLAIRGFSGLSKRYEAVGDFHNALTALDQALAFDSLQEDIHRERIRVLYQSGDRPGAIRHYDYLRRLLDKEMGVPPMKETRDLYDDLINDRLSVNALTQPRPINLVTQRQISLRVAEQIPFTGRHLEMELLRERLAPGYLVLIDGEPGVGKTRLAQEFIKISSMLVISAEARELERTIPYLPWRDGLRNLSTLSDWPLIRQTIQADLLPVWWRELIRMVPGLAGQKAISSPDDQEPDAARLWEGVHQFLKLLATNHPVLIFVDDLQWADSASLGLLGYLVRQEDMANICFLATTRSILPGSVQERLVQTLDRYGRLIQVHLDRLSKAEVSAIAQGITPAYVYPFAEWLQRNSEGNPFILNELIRHLERNNILKPGGQIDLSALSTSPLVPKSVFLLIQSRLGRLSDPARRLLDAAVAAGRDFDLEIVARAAALSDDAAMDAASELENAGLIQPGMGLQYRFDHSLTMEVAYQMTGEPRHRLMHRRLAEALEVSLTQNQLDEMSAEIAAHFVEAKAPQRAAPYAFRAGKQAARLAAWHEAIDFYQQALPGMDDKDRFPVLIALGQAYLASGALAQASDTFQEAYDLASLSQDRGGMDSAAMAQGQAFLPQSRYSEAIAMARQVLDSGLPKNAITAEFIWGTALSLEGEHLDDAAEHLQAAQALCCGLDYADSVNRFNQARILFELGGIAAQRGDLTAALATYRQVIEIACPSGGEGAMYCTLANNNLAYHLLLNNDPSAQQYAEIGLKKAQEYGLFELLPYLYSTLGEIALVQVGDDQRAAEYFQRGLELAERFNMEERIIGLTANMGRVEIKRGQAELAKNKLTFALQKAELLGTRHQWAQIQLWLAPLLPSDERRKRLDAVKAFAEEGGRKGLLDQIQRLKRLP